MICPPRSRAGPRTRRLRRLPESDILPTSGRLLGHLGLGQRHFLTDQRLVSLASSEKRSPRLCSSLLHYLLCDCFTSLTHLHRIRSGIACRVRLQLKDRQTSFSALSRPIPFRSKCFRDSAPIVPDVELVPVCPVVAVFFGSKLGCPSGGPGHFPRRQVQNCCGGLETTAGCGELPVGTAIVTSGRRTLLGTWPPASRGRTRRR